MANATVKEIRKKNETAWLHLGGQLEGMDTHLERADAPGQWTAREVDCHLLFEPGWQAAARRQVFAYLETLGEADLGVMFDRHWSGHAEQLAKIRQAAGLPETK